MSRYVEGECEFTSIRELVKALMKVDTAIGRAWTPKDIQVALDKGQEAEAEALKTAYPGLKVTMAGPQQLEGYQGDKRKQTANVIIPRSQVGGASNDLGWMVEPSGTKQFVSDYDKGFYGKEWGTSLADEYNKAAMDRKCLLNGWTYTETKNAEGETQFLIENM